MPGETEVEQPAAPAAPEVSEEKKDEKAKEAPAKKVKPPPPPPVHKKDFEKDVVYVYQFARTPKVPSVSPYCLKVETWLKFSGIKYEVSSIYI